ncbi:tRNA (adenosine(37)-N6)-dimethylallyltransferase MiaA [Lachnospiraceae bacterium YH-ros2228]
MTIQHNFTDPRPPLIVIAGPTAVGKSDLAIRLAQKIRGEIVSCDSMQVYRGMDIGTAKVTPGERALVPHHMIDILDPTEPCDVRTFKETAISIVRDIQARGKIPILCGGTGFYIQAIVRDIDFTEEDPDMAYREELEEEALRLGNQALHERLKTIDPISYQTIHPNNRKRVIRALEFYHKNKKAISLHNEEEEEKISPFHTFFFVLTDDRARLYQRINERVDLMMKEGLLNEVKSLLDMGCQPSMTSMQGIGYKQLIPVIWGEEDYDSAVDQIKKESRHYAKRQLTWFRREKDVIFLDRRDYPSGEDLLQAVLSKIASDENTDGSDDL